MVESHIVHEMMNFVIHQIFIVITRVAPVFVNEIGIFLTLIQNSCMIVLCTNGFYKSVTFLISTK